MQNFIIRVVAQGEKFVWEKVADDMVVDRGVLFDTYSDARAAAVEMFGEEVIEAPQGQSTTAAPTKESTDASLTLPATEEEKKEEVPGENGGAVTPGPTGVGAAPAETKSE